MKIFNKILNYAVVMTLLFLLGKGVIDSKRSVANDGQPKYRLSFSVDEARNLYPDADSVALEDVNVYYVFDDGNIVGTVVNTSPLSDEIYGYNSVTPLNIFLDNDERVIKVEACKNKEGRGFMNNIINSGFLDSWNGMTAEEAAIHHVDAVSGSTYSSTAMAQSLQIRMQQLSQQKGKSLSWDWNLFFRQLCVFIVTILAAICFFMPRRKDVTNRVSALRTITLLLSIAILGFWTNSLLSLSLFCNWLTNGISLAIQIPLLIVAALSIILPLVTKKSFYCQYLCPFGAAQEFVYRRRTTDNRQQTTSSIKSNIHKVFSVLRKVILLTLLIIFALGLGLDLSVMEPFPIFSYQSIGFGVAIFAGVILVVSIFVKRPWCNYLCPTGTLLETFRTLFK